MYSCNTYRVGTKATRATTSVDLQIPTNAHSHTPRLNVIHSMLR